MPKNVNIPGVGVVSFPDEMNDGQITLAATRLHLEKANQQPLPAAPPLPNAVDFAQNYYRGIGQEQRQLAQQSMNQAIGPESQRPMHPMERVARIGQSLGHETAGVLSGVYGGMADPTQAAVIASGLVDPAIPPAYFSAQAATQLPSSTKQAIQNPTPENVQAPLLQSATIAGSAAGAQSPETGAAYRAVKGVAQAVPEVVRRGAQETLNIGPRLTEKAIAENAPKVAEYNEAVKQVDNLNQSRREAVGQRAQLINDVTENGTKIATGLKELEAAVRSRGGQMFDDIQQAVDQKGVKANLPTLAKAVQDGQSKLAGSPENIKIFNSILGDTQGESVGSSVGNISPGTPLYNTLVEQGAINPASVDFRNLKGYYTELGEKLASGNLPGDVYSAIRTVRQSIGNEMQRMATEAGLGNQLPAARAYWHRYEKTFHDMSAVSQGGSPVARSLRAVDPDYAVAPLVGKAGNRAISMIEQYDPELASVARETVAKYNQAQAMPKKATVTVAPKSPAAIDPVALKQQKLAEIADYMRGSGAFRTSGDILAVEEALRRGSPWPLAYPIGRRAIGAALQRPSLVQWLTQPTAQEMRMVRPPTPPDQAIPGIPPPTR